MLFSMHPPSVCRDPLGTFRVKSSPFELEAPSSFGTYRSKNNLHLIRTLLYHGTLISTIQ